MLTSNWIPYPFTEKKFGGTAKENFNAHLREFNVNWSNRKECKRADFLYSITGEAREYINLASEEELKEFEDIVQLLKDKYTRPNYEAELEQEMIAKTQTEDETVKQYMAKKRRLMMLWHEERRIGKEEKIKKKKIEMGMAVSAREEEKVKQVTEDIQQIKLSKPVMSINDQVRWCVAGLRMEVRDYVERQMRQGTWVITDTWKDMESQFDSLSQWWETFGSKTTKSHSEYQVAALTVKRTQNNNQTSMSEVDALKQMWETEETKRNIEHQKIMLEKRQEIERKKLEKELEDLSKSKRNKEAEWESGEPVKRIYLTEEKPRGNNTSNNDQSQQNNYSRNSQSTQHNHYQNHQDNNNSLNYQNNLNQNGQNNNTRNYMNNQRNYQSINPRNYQNHNPRNDQNYQGRNYQNNNQRFNQTRGYGNSQNNNSLGYQSNNSQFEGERRAQIPCRRGTLESCKKFWNGHCDFKHEEQKKGTYQDSQEKSSYSNFNQIHPDRRVRTKEGCRKWGHTA
jgi:hypothetical protein